MTSWPHGDPREVIRSIVADPRFRSDPAGAPPRRSWLDDIGAWLGQVLRGIFHALDHALGGRSPLEAAIGFIAIGAAFALFGWCVFVLVRSAGFKRRDRNRAAASADVEATVRTAATLRAAALAAGARGRYRDAAVLLFAAAIRALHERGRVADDAARTPGEYRRLVRDPLFDVLAADAVVATFAAAEPCADLFERMGRTYDRLFDEPAR